jgi:glycosyltransferase involved in cell wall biosynthesis
VKVLMSAYACEPHRGSEPEVGWQWARQASELCEVWVLTRANNRAIIEREMQAHPSPSMHFIYHDLPGWVRRLKHKRRGLTWYYWLWQLSAIPVVRREHRVHHFDVAHHITFVSFRYPSALAPLPIPFVWGPVAGADGVPQSFYMSLGVKGLLNQLLRDTSNAVARFDPLTRFTLRRAALVIAATSATSSELSMWHPGELRLEQAIGLDVSLAPHAVLSRKPSAPGPMKVLYVGNLLFLKGLHLALEAFARFLETGGEGSLTIVGDGEFRPTLERLVYRLQIEDRVSFLGERSRDEVLHLYQEHDLFVFPSIRDSGGIAVLEAMAAGLPVLCLDLGGPSLIVTPESGIRVPAESPKQVVAEMAAAMHRFSSDSDLRCAMGRAAHTRIRNVYAWEHKREVLRDVYRSVTGQQQW